MPPPGIIEVFDIIEHLGFGLVSRAVGLGCRTLGLQRGEEALHCGIVPAVTGSAYATDHAMVSHEPLEGLTGVLAPPIGVVQDRLRLVAPPDRHHEGVRDQLRGHRRLHQPADDPA